MSIHVTFPDGAIRDYARGTTGTAVVESISPQGSPAKHVVHIVFAGYLGGRSLEAVTSKDAAVRGHRLFGGDELLGLPLHPPIQRFLARWEPGDPVVYLGAMWAP